VVGTMQGAVPVAELQRAGVKRISMGVALYARVMADLRSAARQLAAGDTAAATAGISFREILRMIADAGQAPREG
jgi:2-methylisocitrate lyase-like PEP mutase family enzyme